MRQDDISEQKLHGTPVSHNPNGEVRPLGPKTAKPVRAFRGSSLSRRTLRSRRASLCLCRHSSPPSIWRLPRPGTLSCAAVTSPHTPTSGPRSGRTGRPGLQMAARQTEGSAARLNRGGCITSWRTKISLLKCRSTGGGGGLGEGASARWGRARSPTVSRRASSRGAHAAQAHYDSLPPAPGEREPSGGLWRRHLVGLFVAVVDWS